MALLSPNATSHQLCAKLFGRFLAATKILRLQGVTVIFSFAIPTTFAQNRNTPVLTVCEALHTRFGYDGKTVVVVGRLGRTMEGGSLNQNCSEALTTNGYTWPNDISIGHEDSDEGVLSPPSMNGFKWKLNTLFSKVLEVNRSA